MEKKYEITNINYKNDYTKKYNNFYTINERKAKARGEPSKTERGIINTATSQRFIALLAAFCLIAFLTYNPNGYGQLANGEMQNMQFQEYNGMQTNVPTIEVILTRLREAGNRTEKLNIRGWVIGFDLGLVVGSTNWGVFDFLRSGINSIVRATQLLILPIEGIITLYYLTDGLASSFM